MNVIDTASGGKESTYMKTFTIDAENNITIHANRKAAKETGLAVFASEEQFTELIGTDSKRVVEIWNSLPGVKPVAKFANRTTGIQRIWKAIQNLESGPTEASSETTGEAATEPAGQVDEQPAVEPEVRPSRNPNNR
jgi:hypothetical protein